MSMPGSGSLRRGLTPPTQRDPGFSPRAHDPRKRPPASFSKTPVFQAPPFEGYRALAGRGAPRRWRRRARCTIWGRRRNRPVAPGLRAPGRAQGRPGRRLRGLRGPRRLDRGPPASSSSGRLRPGNPGIRRSRSSAVQGPGPLVSRRARGPPVESRPPSSFHRSGIAGPAARAPTRGGRRRRFADRAKRGRPGVPFRRAGEILGSPRQNILEKNRAPLWKPGKKGR